MNMKNWDWAILTAIFIVLGFWAWVLVLLYAG